MKKDRTPQIPAVHLERGSRISLERQLVQGLRAAILQGSLPAGTRLASQRQLAKEYQMHRNGVVGALETLQAEGYLETVHGSGTFVAQGSSRAGRVPQNLQPGRWLRPLPTAQVDPPVRTDLLEFRVCQPSVQGLDGQAWLSSVKHAGQQPLSEDYLHPQGLPELREQVARHLTRSRGLTCTAEDVLITSGALQAIDLVAQAILRPGDGVAFEDPGYRLARQVLQSRGGTVQPIPVDEDGLQVQQVQGLATPPLLVYVTPSHQFPLGGRLSLQRRLALLEWASRFDGLILEDDYDSEFRYDAPPLPPLASLDDQGRVVYVGTFSKVLSPSLRLGYVVAAPAVLQQLVQVKQLADYHAPALTQQALADFMEKGAFDRHLRKMRQVYGARRQQLQPLEGCVPGVHLQGLQAGLHAFLALPDHLPAAEVVEACLQRGVLVRNASTYALEGSSNGLVLGYGHLTASQLEQGVQVLLEVLAGLHRHRYSAGL